MQWNSLGFQHNPFNTDPINQETLQLYTGRKESSRICHNVLAERNVLLVVEGARGVGTTSFANYLRFTAQAKKDYLTPRNEIRVESGWSSETVLGVVVANVVREMALFHANKVKKDKRFMEARALSMRIAEVYRSFGVSAFGAGMSYGKSVGFSSMPAVAPTPILGHHLEDLSDLAVELGYRYGLLIQLNNLDIGAIHDETSLRHLFNALRDYFQTRNTSWILVGDIGIRRFIAQQVDRLDDIISYEVDILPIDKKEYQAIFEKRLLYYRLTKTAILPIDEEVLFYLYEKTQGCLRYIFGLLHRLFQRLHVGDLTDKITLDIAKPMLIQLTKDRIIRNNLSVSEKSLLRLISTRDKINSTSLADKMQKTRQYVSNLLGKLVKLELVKVHPEGRNLYYSPMLDVIMAYSEEEVT